MKYRNVSKRYGAKIAVAGTALVLGIGNAIADTTSYLDPGVQTGYTTAKSDFGLIASYAWPIIILVAFTFVGVRFFKRGAGKL